MVWALRECHGVGVGLAELASADGTALKWARLASTLGEQMPPHGSAGRPEGERRVGTGSFRLDARSALKRWRDDARTDPGACLRGWTRWAVAAGAPEIRVTLSKDRRLLRLTHEGVVPPASGTFDPAAELPGGADVDFARGLGAAFALKPASVTARWGRPARRVVWTEGFLPRVELQAGTGRESFVEVVAGRRPFPRSLLDELVARSGASPVPLLVDGRAAGRYAAVDGPWRVAVDSGRVVGVRVPPHPGPASVLELCRRGVSVCRVARILPGAQVLAFVDDPELPFNASDTAVIAGDRLEAAVALVARAASDLVIAVCADLPALAKTQLGRPALEALEAEDGRTAAPRGLWRALLDMVRRPGPAYVSDEFRLGRPDSPETLAATLLWLWDAVTRTAQKIPTRSDRCAAALYETPIFLRPDWLHKGGLLSLREMETELSRRGSVPTTAGFAQAPLPGFVRIVGARDRRALQAIFGEALGDAGDEARIADERARRAHELWAAEIEEYQRMNDIFKK